MRRASAFLFLRTVVERLTDAVGAALLTAMFISFMVQIIWRYVLQSPLGWTLEACLLCWLWVVLWGGAFMLKDRDHVRFDILFLASPGPVRRVMAAIAALAFIAAFASALPATWDFIDFMAIEKSSLLKIPFNQVFGLYIVFAGAVIARYAYRLFMIARGHEPE